MYILKKKRKLAVLFYGRIKKFDVHYQNIMEKIVKDNNVDFFLSHSPELNENLEEFIKLYKPKKIINDEIIYDCSLLNLKRIYYYTDAQIHSMFCHFINKKRVFNLLTDYINETKTNYDYIIIYRVDLFSDSCLNYQEFNEIDNNILYIPSGNDYENGLNDQIAIGNFEVIKTYCNIYDNVLNIVNKYYIYLHPETLFKYHLLDTYVNVNRFNLSYSIMR